MGVDRGRHYTKGNAVAETPAPAVAEPGKGLGLMRTPTSAVGYSFFDQGGATPVMRA